MDPYGATRRDLEPETERRTHLRLPAGVAVRLRRREHEDWLSGVCTDISQGGIGLETPEVLGVGELIEVQPAEVEGSVILRGRVMYRHDLHYGVAFLDYTPA